METIFSRDSNNSNNYIAFFDLDRTISKATSGNALIRCAYKKDLMTRYDLARAIYLNLLYKLRLRDPQQIIDEMVKWVKGISEKTMDELCFEVYYKVLLPSVYQEAISEIKIHKGKNAKTVILSSALSSVCRTFSTYLGMDDIICSDLEVENGFLTGRPVGRLCFGEEKAVRLREYCRQNNINPGFAWYYGDSISDLPALRNVGNPVCVNPDNKLRKTARKKGWKILFWNCHSII